MTVILFLESNPGGNGIRAMRQAQQWGYQAQFLTRNLAEYHGFSPSPTEVADEVIVVDTLDIMKLLRLSYPKDVVATMAFDDLRVVPAALLGAYLGVPHNPSVRGLLNVRYKDRTRTLLNSTQFGLRHVICNLQDAPSESPIGYPCVVKPVDEAGSTGVRVCEDGAGFRLAVETIREMAARPNRRGYCLIPSLLVEEFVVGNEYSAEIVWSVRENDWRLIGFTRKQISPAPWCLETGELFPHSFDDNLSVRVFHQLRACLRLLELQGSLVHFEFRLRGDKVCVIEVNPRSAGGRIPDLVRHALGIDLVTLQLAAHLGTADTLLDHAQLNACAGVRYLTPPHPGTVSGFDIAPLVDTALVDIRTVATPVHVAQATSNTAQTVEVVVRADSPAAVDQALERHAARITHRYATQEQQSQRLYSVSHAGGWLP
jgi:hypothetical protein